MDKRTIILAGQSQRDTASKLSYEVPIGWQVTFKEPTRKEIQSKKFHAMCGDISKQATYIGRTLTKNQWKVLFISAHAVATEGQGDIIPGLEGEFCNIRESTSQMSIKRMASVIEYVQAWASNHEPPIRWSARLDK